MGLKTEQQRLKIRNVDIQELSDPGEILQTGTQERVSSILDCDKQSYKIWKDECDSFINPQINVYIQILNLLNCQILVPEEIRSVHCQQ